jgi:hypothetical protein
MLEWGNKISDEVKMNGKKYFGMFFKSLSFLRIIESSFWLEMK